MSLSLLAPLFLAGLGLMLVPWLIHRIQRPQRRPVRFSSLLFIPQMDREVVQRRRLQHLLLLLLRVSVLALLAFAFSRPFLSAETTATAERKSSLAHVLLIDRSFSMGTGTWIENARARGQEVLESIPEAEPVAIVAFDERAEVLMGLDAGDRPLASKLLKEIQVSQFGTSFTEALQEARNQLEAAGVDGTTMRGVIHLISDLQEVGFGERPHSSWRLPPGIEVRPIEVGEEGAANRGIVDTAVRNIREGEFRISAKIKNWTVDGEVPFPVTLHVLGKEVSRQEVTVLRHHASQVSFDWRGKEAAPIEGWIEIAGDSLETDNRRYFAWNPSPRRTIAIVTRNRGAEAWPSGWFVQAALNGAGDSTWEVIPVSIENAADWFASEGVVPEVVVAGELDGADDSLNRAILDYLGSGGRAMLTLAAEASPQTLNSGLLGPLGLQAREKLAPDGRESPYSLISWIDFEHPIFHAFQAPQFNDFSAIRIFDHLALNTSESEDVPPRPLVQIEAGEAESTPGLIEVVYGKGRALVWSFPHDPRLTNLPKSARFAPIILESMRYLTGADDERTEVCIGEVVAAGQNISPAQLRTADGRTLPLDLAEAGPAGILVKEAGLLTGAGVEGLGERTIPVNPDPAEGNPLRISPEVFRLRVMPPEGSVSGAGVETSVGVVGGRSPRGAGREFGLALLLAVAGLLFVELWYAPRLVR